MSKILKLILIYFPLFWLSFFLSQLLLDRSATLEKLKELEKKVDNDLQQKYMELDDFSFRVTNE